MYGSKNISILIPLLPNVYKVIKFVFTFFPHVQTMNPKYRFLSLPSYKGISAISFH